MGQAVYPSLLQVSFCGNAKLILQTPQPQTLTCIFTSCPLGDVPTAVLPQAQSQFPRPLPPGPVGHVALRSMPCLSFRRVLWVTLNCPFSGIGLSMLSLSHLYKLNLSTVQHYTPVKMYNLQRYSTTWVNLTITMLRKGSQAHKDTDFRYDSKCIKDKSRQNWSMPLEVRIAVTLGQDTKELWVPVIRTCQNIDRVTPLRYFHFSGSRLYYKKSLLVFK